MRRLLRLRDVLNASGFKTTSLYGRINAGLMTPPVKLTERSSAWPEDEVAAINEAVIAGKSNEEIRALVSRLVATRSQRSAA